MDDEQRLESLDFEAVVREAFKDVVAEFELKERAYLHGGGSVDVVLANDYVVLQPFMDRIDLYLDVKIGPTEGNYDYLGSIMLRDFKVTGVKRGFSELYKKEMVEAGLKTYADFLLGEGRSLMQRPDSA